jgi:hypothetical protein
LADAASLIALMVIAGSLDHSKKESETMALLGNLVGTVDGLVGGLLGASGGASSSTDLQAATNPTVDLSASHVLEAAVGGGDTGGIGDIGLSGIGDLGLHVEAPTFVGVSSTTDASATAGGDTSNHGGLLGGLL